MRKLMAISSIVAVYLYVAGLTSLAQSPVAESEKDGKGREQPAYSFPDRKAALEIEPQPDADNIFIGNVDSMKFHRCSCEYAKMMHPCRRVRFLQRSAAQMAGMSPCAWCLPLWTLSVEARLIWGSAGDSGRKTGERDCGFDHSQTTAGSAADLTR